jgi:phthalate 4,5-dioxygenase oxygenase subunit
MLSPAENEFVTRIGPRTPMGELLRRYWQPFLLSAELGSPDSPPVRVKLLGERLIAFRDSAGRPGLLQEHCPHRGASLYYGINDQGGVRCIYHGWKFDVEGACTDMPSDMPGNTFKERVRARAYPVLESAGALWAYMGPPEKQPAPPSFFFNKLPLDQVVAIRTPIYCNYLQSIEGNIDSTHIGTLHVYYAHEQPVDDGTDRPGYPSAEFSTYLRSLKYAQVDVQDTDYGLRLIAIRDTPRGNKHVRINCLAMPLMTFISSPRGSGSCFTQLPIDDENCMRVGFHHRLDRPFTPEEREEIIARSMVLEEDGRTRLKRAENDYLIDRDAQKTIHPAGITPSGEQDYCVTESMGAILDRSEEHLYAADAAIIRFRQMLIAAARNLQEGEEPPGLDADIPFDRIRAEEIIIGPDEDPWLVATHAGEASKRGEKVFA